MAITWLSHGYHITLLVLLPLEIKLVAQTQHGSSLHHRLHLVLHVVRGVHACAQLPVPPRLVAAVRVRRLETERVTVAGHADHLDVDGAAEIADSLGGHVAHAAGGCEGDGVGGGGQDEFDLAVAVLLVAVVGEDEFHADGWSLWVVPEIVLL